MVDRCERSSDMDDFGIVAKLEKPIVEEGEVLCPPFRR